MAKDMCAFADKITQTGNLLTKKGFLGIEVTELCCERNVCEWPGQNFF